jgi:hypothetical protein
MRTVVCSIAALLGWALIAIAENAEPARGKEGLDAFRAYLKKQYSDKKWQTGPSRLDSKAIQSAYGTQRFYFVFSRPPFPPGANIKSIQDAYRRRLAEFNKTHISLVVRYDKGQVVPLLGAKDYNVSLKKVTSDETAATVATAILSLYGSGRVSPGLVEPKEVRVTKVGKGWSCVVQKVMAFQGTVVFDADGRCTSVSKFYTGPLPP